jgi:hypothetical protein
MSGYLIQSDGRPLADVESRLARYLPGLDARLLPLSDSRAIVRSHLLQALATEYTAPREAWLSVLGIADLQPLNDEQAVGLLLARQTDELPQMRPATAIKAAGLDWHLHAVNVQPAWALLGGPGGIPWGTTKVAHLDTGYTRHPAFGFEGTTWVDMVNAQTDMPPPPNGGDHFVLPEPGNAQDPMRGFSAGHGTRMGATICGFAPGAPGGAYFGIAPKVPYLPMRITDAVLINHAQRQFATALRHVVDVGQAGAVNISLGIFASTILPELRAALNHAYERGVIVVCAAGNIVDPVVAPARLRRTVAVAGVTRDDLPWSGSSFGLEVDFSAPAADLRRADTAGQTKPRFGYRAGGDGTSYASAITTGAAALWLTHRRADLAAAYDQPWCTVAAFTKLARDTARLPAGVAWDPDGAFGRGILDIGALVAAPLPPQAALTEDEPA